MNSCELIKFIEFCKKNLLNIEFILNPENISKECLIEWRDKKDIYWDVIEDNRIVSDIYYMNVKTWELESKYQFVCTSGRVQQLYNNIIECNQCIFGNYNGDEREYRGCQKRVRQIYDDGNVKSISQCVYENIDWFVDMILKIREECKKNDYIYIS